MLNERENKIKITDEQIPAVKALCLALNGQDVEELQIDEYFDTPVRGLEAEDLTLRIRRIGGRIRIAMKSKRVYLTETIHDRIELEFTAADEKEIISQIKRQQLIVSAVIEKRRWKVKGDDYKVVIDTLPFIGAFVEVEATSVDRITEITNFLQLSSANGVSKNYTELIEARLKEIGLPIRPNLRATFEEEDKWIRQSRLT